MKYLSNRIGEKPQHLDVYYLSRLPFAISSFSSIYIYIYIRTLVVDNYFSDSYRRAIDHDP